MYRIYIVYRPIYTVYIVYRSYTTYIHTQIWMYLCMYVAIQLCHTTNGLHMYVYIYYIYMHLQRLACIYLCVGS